MPELVLAIVRIAIVALLWLFVLAAVRVIRTDIYGPRAARPARARPAPAPRAPKQAKAAKPTKSGKSGKGRDVPSKLVITAGALAGTSIALREAPVTIGRANDSTLVLADDYASNRHARLVPSDNGWLVEDLGSTNGTYLDRTKVTAPMPVPLGMPIRIGKTVLELRR
jgi:pSer/pThr/pTyr-binding forkhead associated (FHA) protein